MLFHFIKMFFIKNFKFNKSSGGKDFDDKDCFVFKLLFAIIYIIVIVFLVWICMRCNDREVVDEFLFVTTGLIGFGD